MPPLTVTPSGPGISEGWTRLVEAIGLALPVAEIDGVSSVSEGEDHDRRVIIVPA